MGKKILLLLFFASNFSSVNAFVYPPDDDEQEPLEESEPPLSNLGLGAMPISKEIDKEINKYLSSCGLDSDDIRIVLPPEASPLLAKMMYRLIEKWDFTDDIDDINIILVPNIHVSLKNTAKNATLNLGRKLFDIFADEEIEAAISREFARFKKKHAQLEKQFLQITAIVLFFHFNVFDELMQGKLISPGVFALWTVMHFKRFLPPLSWLRRGHETEADSLGAIVGNTEKASITFLIRLYFYQNQCLPLLKESIDENLIFIETREKNKFPFIESLQLLLIDHPTPYQRLQNVCDLYRQISTNKKSFETLNYEKYKRLSKWREWMTKISFLFNSALRESDKKTI